MGGIYRLQGDLQNAHKISVRKPEGKKITPKSYE
jgi:hypothetical protein